MPVQPAIAARHEELTAWRRDFHAHPETAFEETRTSDLVAERLESWGLEVHRGLGGTGVVGVLRAGNGTGSLGLRADMDALPMQEEADTPHRSTIPGKMHACGHDGHTTMLLGAARYLAETRNFNGAVHFIFQPAEEAGGGAKRMIEDGLFEKFPCDEVFAIHNTPKLPVGVASVHAGPMLAAVDAMIVTITGKGAHGARPHEGNDPISVGVQLHTALQHVATKSISPLEPAVINVTQFHAGTAINVAPQRARIAATIRSLDPGVRDRIEARVREICDGLAKAYGVEIDLEYRRSVSPTINTPAEAEMAAEAAADVLGVENVRRNEKPVTGGEDFSEMLAVKPGAFLYIGGGKSDDDFGLHHPRYDFNDDILPIGASYFANLVERRLSREQGESAS
ncbi:amidohydrolase [Pikeienuella piscinae]|uniref:Amidohydrolase n=1 Tax=Pikeienuella piscinae TaxID=2748098 RepID=A0A7M3T5J6_9RHOB|nr:M20 aminoacylase family protein [Pikeienuella piscinae]QIE57277.1 amidohydrolase [Pikeienuella piscinae]